MTTERGQATIETLLLGLLLLVPLIWLLGVLADIHRTALATTSAVRDAGVSAARTSSVDAAARAIGSAVERALVDHGLDPADAELNWKAVPRFRRGARLQIDVRYPVTVAQAPLLGRVAGPSVWIDARHLIRLHPFASKR